MERTLSITENYNVQEMSLVISCNNYRVEESLLNQIESIHKPVPKMPSTLSYYRSNVLQSGVSFLAEAGKKDNVIFVFSRGNENKIENSWMCTWLRKPSKPFIEKQWLVGVEIFIFIPDSSQLMLAETWEQHGKFYSLAWNSPCSTQNPQYFGKVESEANMENFTSWDK